MTATAAGDDDSGRAATYAARDLVWVDTETTGLEPGRHQMIEVALIRTSADGREVKARFESLVRLLPGAFVDPRALAKCRLEPRHRKFAERARPMREVLGDVAAFLGAAPYQLAGHNVAFDAAFLAASFARVGRPSPALAAGGPPVCTQALAQPLARAGVVPNRQLATLCAHYGVAGAGAHRAGPDIEATRALYCAMRGRIAVELAARAAGVAAAAAAEPRPVAQPVPQPPIDTRRAAPAAGAEAPPARAFVARDRAAEPYVAPVRPVAPSERLTAADLERHNFGAVLAGTGKALPYESHASYDIDIALPACALCAGVAARCGCNSIHAGLVLCAPTTPFVAYTDGSGTTAKTHAGIGVVLTRRGVTIAEASVAVGLGSNNFAEVFAIGRALALTYAVTRHRATRLVVRSDSQFAIGAVRHGSTWNVTASPQLAAAVRALRAEVERWPDLAFEHVDGHSGIEGNERADALAGRARKAGIAAAGGDGRVAGATSPPTAAR